MPVGGEAFGSAIGGFFGGPKIKAIEYNKYLNDTINDQAIGLRGLRKIGDTAADAYAASLTGSTPEFERINADTISRLSGLADQYGTFDPTSTYERVRSGNIASLADQFVNLANYGQEGDKLALAVRGYGGRGPGSYESILRSDRISKNIAPVLNTIFGNLGIDTASLNQNRLQNLAATMGVLQARHGLPDAGAARTLLPYEARLSMLGREIPLSGQVAEATKANTAGYEQTQNKWANFFQQMGRATDQLGDFAMNGAQTALSAYTGGAFGGMGGGGGGGGGAAPSAPPAGVRNFYMNPTSAPGNSPYGPYASGYQFPYLN